MVKKKSWGDDKMGMLNCKRKEEKMGNKVKPKIIWKAEGKKMELGKWGEQRDQEWEVRVGGEW